MDLNSGRTYGTREAALADGVPSSDIAEVDGEEVRFASGPFKGRVYKRTATGLVRVSLKHGDVTKSDGAGNLVRIKANEAP